MLGAHWHVFTGNEIGTLLGYWQILKWKEQHPGSEVVPAVLASVVSSRMLKHIAGVEGIRYFDTLTGTNHR
jgi:phosphomannomutase